MPAMNTGLSVSTLPVENRDEEMTTLRERIKMTDLNFKELQGKSEISKVVFTIFCGKC